MAHKRDVRHEQEGVMEYESKDVEMDMDVDVDTDNESKESDLTPLSSEEEDNGEGHDGDENTHPFREFRSVSKSIGRLQQWMGDLSQEHAEIARPGVEVEGTSVAYECTGVTHLVHAWFEQGRKGNKYALIPSNDMCKGSYASLAVNYYFRATANIASFLGAYFEVAFPEEYIRYKNAFAAGVWLPEDPGPWLGRAIVYKLQVKPHQDRKDGGPTAIFNVGQYTGGELYFPDLHLKFRYKPGDIFIFPAGELYHAVGDWKPSGHVNEYGIVPGRIGHVFFSQKSPLEKLCNHPPGWRNDTYSGFWPSVKQQKQVQKRRVK